MQKQRSFAVIGGDRRIIELANLLYADGNTVNVYGISAQKALNAPCTAVLEEAVYGAELVILPLPMLDKSGMINAPYAASSIYLTDVLKLMNNKQVLFAGNIPESAKKLCEIYGLYTNDYFKCEALTVTNAMLTAEGAIQTVLNAYPKALYESRILIIGYGRIGKFLAKLLNGFGADVTVSGRRAETAAWVRAGGMKYIQIQDEFINPQAYDIVINTVPEPILTQERIHSLKQDVLILDLASGKGGTDFEYAKSRGIEAIHALSLPGKTAPLAAGKAIKETIVRICDELGV